MLVHSCMYSGMPAIQKYGKLPHFRSVMAWSPLSVFCCTWTSFPAVIFSAINLEIMSEVDTSSPGNLENGWVEVWTNCLARAFEAWIWLFEDERDDLKFQELSTGCLAREFVEAWIWLFDDALSASGWHGTCNNWSINWKVWQRGASSCIELKHIEGYSGDTQLDEFGIWWKQSW